MPTFVLLHSPLVGPFTWKPVAETLKGEARMPSFLPSDPRAFPHRSGSATPTRLPNAFAASLVQNESS